MGFLNFNVTLIARFLQNRKEVRPRSPEFGELFETYLFHELRAYADYRSAGEVCYWRSVSGFEVDFILSDQTAIEAKASAVVSARDLKGLKALAEEKKMKRHILVCFEKTERTVGGIQILPWALFLDRLWSGDYE